MDEGIDVIALEDVGRKEAEHRFAGAVDDDALGHEFGGDLFGQVGGVELYAKHEAYAANVDDGSRGGSASLES